MSNEALREQFEDNDLEIVCEWLENASKEAIIELLWSKVGAGALEALKDAIIQDNSKMRDIYEWWLNRQPDGPEWEPDNER